MLRPKYTVKYGVFLKTSLKEYEHFVAHIVDTSTEGGIVQYEIPV